METAIGHDHVLYRFSQCPQANSFKTFDFLRSGDLLSSSVPLFSFGPFFGPLSGFFFLSVDNSVDEIKLS